MNSAGSTLNTRSHRATMEREGLRARHGSVSGLPSAEAGVGVGFQDQGAEGQMDAADFGQTVESARRSMSEGDPSYPLGRSVALEEEVFASNFDAFVNDPPIEEDPQQTVAGFRPIPAAGRSGIRRGIAGTSRSGPESIIAVVRKGDAEEDSGIPDDWICAICMEVMDEPGSPVCKCRMRYCRTCLLKALHEKQECPTCRVPCTPQQIIPDKVLAGLMSSSQMTCTNKGCTDRMMPLLWKGHRNQCAFTTITCQHMGLGCTWTGDRRSLADHLRLCPCHVLSSTMYDMQRRIQDLSVVCTNLQSSFAAPHLGTRLYDTNPMHYWALLWLFLARPNNVLSLEKTRWFKTFPLARLIASFAIFPVLCLGVGITVGAVLPVDEQGELPDGVCEWQSSMGLPCLASFRIRLFIFLEALLISLVLAIEGTRSDMWKFPWFSRSAIFFCTAHIMSYNEDAFMTSVTFMAATLASDILLELQSSKFAMSFQMGKFVGMFLSPGFAPCPYIFLVANVVSTLMIGVVLVLNFRLRCLVLANCLCLGLYVWFNYSDSEWAYALPVLVCKPVEIMVGFLTTEWLRKNMISAIRYRQVNRYPDILRVVFFISISAQFVLVRRCMPFLFVAPAHGSFLL